mgnify:CR=1 FL=1
MHDGNLTQFAVAALQLHLRLEPEVFGRPRTSALASLPLRPRLPCGFARLLGATQTPTELETGRALGRHDARGQQRAQRGHALERAVRLRAHFLRDFDASLLDDKLLREAALNGLVERTLLLQGDWQSVALAVPT